MKQLLTNLLFLAVTVFAGEAQNDSDIYKYAVDVDADERYAECRSGMMGDVSNDFNPSVYHGSDGRTNIYFKLLSHEDYESHPVNLAEIKITFDNGRAITFASAHYTISDDLSRMKIQMLNVTAEQLSLFATRDIVAWTMDGHTISIKSPTAGMFAAMFKAVKLREVNGHPIAMCDAEPTEPIGGRHHLCLSVVPPDSTIKPHGMLLSPDQWRRLKDKEKYEKQSLLINYDKNRCFFVDYYDRYDECGYPDWFTAVEMYGDRFPTALMGAILSQTTELRAVACAFGGDNYGNYYWTSTICNDSDGSEAYVFCPAIPDAPIDRQNMTEPTNAGVVLVDIPFEETYDYYLSDTLQ